MSEGELLDSWDANAARWTEAVRAGAIASRRLGTDQAILAAIARRPPRRVLDLGCGEGWLTRALAERSVEVLGVDASAELIAAAERAGPGRHFFCCAYAELDRERIGGPVDLVVANFALLAEALGLEALAGLLEPGGRLLIQTLHPLGAGPPYRDGWRREDFAGFGEGEWAPMPWYFRTLGSWLASLSAAGFVLEAIDEPLHPKTERPLSIIFDARLTERPRSGDSSRSGKTRPPRNR